MFKATISRSFLVFVCLTSAWVPAPARPPEPMRAHFDVGTGRALARSRIDGWVTSPAVTRPAASVRSLDGRRTPAVETSVLLLDAPTFDPPAGTYAAGQKITIATDTPDAVITYTLDGTEPTASDPTMASGGTIVAGHVTVKAKAWKTGDTPSATTTARSTSE